MTCPTCPVASSCHNPRRPVASCQDRSGFWSLEGRAEWESLLGRAYPPARGRGIDHQRERLEAAATELRAAGWTVHAPGASL